jgi:hypothetical protein
LVDRHRQVGRGDLDHFGPAGHDQLPVGRQERHNLSDVGLKKLRAVQSGISTGRRTRIEVTHHLVKLAERHVQPLLGVVPLDPSGNRNGGYGVDPATLHPECRGVPFEQRLQ